MPSDFVNALLGRPKPVTDAESVPTQPIPPEGGYRTAPPSPRDPVAEHNGDLAALLTSSQRPNATAERESIEEFASDV
jgi:hypothetical protein